MLDDDVPQVLVGLADVHALDGLGCLTGVLVMKTSVHKRSRPK